MKGRIAAVRGPILFWLAVFFLALGSFIPLDQAVGKAGSVPLVLPTATPLGQSRTVIKYGELLLIVDDLPQAVSQVNEILLRYGGRAEDWKEWTYVSEGSSVLAIRMKLRLPSTEFETVLADLRGLADETLNELVYTREIGDQIVELKANLRALAAEEKRLLALQQAADTDQARRQVDEDLAPVQEALDAAAQRLEELEELIRWATLALEMRQYTPLPTATPTVTPTPRPTPTARVWNIESTYQAAIDLRGEIMGFFTSLESLCIFSLCCLPVVLFGGIVYNLFFARLRKK